MNINAANRQCTSDLTVKAELINQKEQFLAIEALLIKHYGKNNAKKYKSA